MYAEKVSSQGKSSQAYAKPVNASEGDHGKSIPNLGGVNK
jgi:hypothetical protein